MPLEVCIFMSHVLWYVWFRYFIVVVKKIKKNYLNGWMAVVACCLVLYRMDADRMAPKRKSTDSLYTDCSRSL